LKFNKNALLDVIVSGLLTLLMLFASVKFIDTVFPLLNMEKTGAVYVNAFVFSVVTFSGLVNLAWFDYIRFKIDEIVKRVLPTSKKSKLDQLSEEADKLKEA
jgi:hypothetical protein